MVGLLDQLHRYFTDSVRVYVFGSAAYLAALAVTVLIVYLMNPPVSNAIQGAFFVAAFITGVLFGALALIFPDLTEGLGCLLGGFCLGMWFMSLKEGGLIGSTGGRAIFIGCMSVASYSLSFSHYTRTYGLIGSISFSGATITILGVDCFSRAGWKEFWLYIWSKISSCQERGCTTDMNRFESRYLSTRHHYLSDDKGPEG